MLTDKLKAVLRILAGIVMLLMGVIVSLIADGATGVLGVLGQSLGIALIITGAVSVFQESVLVPLKKTETQDRFDKLSSETKEGFENILNVLGKDDTGLQILCNERAGFKGYHKWMLETKPQELFFAGRSVLHRIEKDFKERNFVSVSEAFIHKMKNGTTIRILFLNPNWELIDQIAVQEGRNSAKELYADLNISLRVVKSLWDTLQKQEEPLTGSLEVRLFANISHYAYHCVKETSSNDLEMLVGFYFAERLGWQSALFEVKDPSTQSLFERHFAILFDSAEQLLVYPGGRVDLAQFNSPLYEKSLNYVNSRRTGVKHSV